MRFCSFFFFFKQKTAYEMRISDWSSDVCSSDLPPRHAAMSVESQLLTLSPLDGLYAAKVDAPRPIFSEYGLPKARVRVEVEWQLALAAEQGIGELAAFPEPAISRLRALADGFYVADAARVKDIERTTHHD